MKESSKGAAALAALPAAVKSDPVYLFARVKVLRRADKNVDAAQAAHFRAARRKCARRSRRVVGRAAARFARARSPAATRSSPTRSPPATRPSRRRCAPRRNSTPAGTRSNSCTTRRRQWRTSPTSRRSRACRSASSRAEYWLGRAAEAAGDMAGATAHFATPPPTRPRSTASSRSPASAARRCRSASRRRRRRRRSRTSRVANWSRRSGTCSPSARDDQTGVFFRSLAETLTDPAEIALLARLADDEGQHNFSLQIGKIAAGRGLPVDTLAFPTAAIPVQGQDAQRRAAAGLRHRPPGKRLQRGRRQRRRRARPAAADAGNRQADGEDDRPALLEGAPDLRPRLQRDARRRPPRRRWSTTSAART